MADEDEVVVDLLPIAKALLMHARVDGTYVINYCGQPYHVTKTDEKYENVHMLAQLLDEPLPPEIIPQPLPVG